MEMIFSKHSSYIALIALALLLLTSCDDVSSTSEPLNHTQTISKTTEKGPLRVEVLLSPAQVLVAQPTRLTLTASAPRGVDIRMPEKHRELGSLQVLDFKTHPAVPESDGRRWTQIYTLESLKPGKIEVPPLPLVYTDSRGDEPIMDELQTPSLELEVASVLEANADPLSFRDIKSSVAVTANKTENSTTTYIYVVLGVGVAIISAICLMVWLRHRTPMLSPAEKALRNLEEVQQAIHEENSDFQAVYYHLTDTVRTYIEDQFGLRARTLTSPEFLEQVHRKGALPAEHQHRLDELIQISDLVKYARFNPGSKNAEQMIEAAKHFVEETSQPKQEAA